MKEARTYGAVNFDYRGDPRSVADWRFRGCLPEMLAKMARDPAKLCGCLDDVSAVNVVGVLHNEMLDLVLKGSRFFRIQGDLTLPFAWPHERTIERFGS